MIMKEIRASNNLIVITGGPGSGKTSLLNAFSEDGYQVVPEVARNIIREQLEQGGNALPWQNNQSLTDLMSASRTGRKQCKPILK